MKINKYIAVLGILTLPLVGCSDFLEKDNKSTANVDGNKYLESHPEALRATAFESLRANLVNIDMQDLASDLYNSPRSGNNGVFAQFAITAATDAVATFYKNNSKTINYANGMIKFGGEGSKLSEEGRFLRAYCYYIQTQQFGGVPYVTHYVEDSSRDYPRTPLDEIYVELVRDLTDLYNNSSLPLTDHNGEISKQAVAALCARVCLAAGWDLETSLTDAEKGTYSINSTNYFNQAAEWAEKAINGTQLTMSFEQKWSPFNEGNDEVIWSNQYRRDGFPGDVSDGGHSLQNNYCAYFGDPVKTGQKGCKDGGTNMYNNKSIMLFGPGDQRFDGTFMSIMYNSMLNDGVAEWGNKGYYAYYNATDAEKATLPIAAKYFPWYTTVDEVKAYLEAHKSQTVQFTANTSGWNQPYAAILDANGVTKFSFNPDGSYKAPETFEFSAFNDAVYNGMCVKKFDDPQSIQSTSGNDYRNLVIFHVSEMYLVAAEAYLMAGKEPQALAKVNDVRRRAGAILLNSFDEYPDMVEYSVNPLTFGNITKLDCILDECAREMYAERKRWYDLRRTRQLVRYNLAFSRDIRSVALMSNGNGEIKWYRPIPETEINNNTAMSFEKDQNPGY
ncbi:MAG: RagB/SusD family nutrient uptake outer membrane protein [Muribaculaceae bacterium]|nr:RagB/SusD family nutrient uptake outer membrane protein [Muribaculaceae bacterium]